MGLFDDEASGFGCKSVSFNGPPGTGQRGMIVLARLPKRQAREFGTGKPKFWKRKGVQTSDPIPTIPYLVWCPGPDNRGLIDPTVPGDVGVRVIFFEKGKSLSKAMDTATEAIGRQAAEQGDIIGAWFTAQDAQTNLKDYSAEAAIGTPDHVAFAKSMLEQHNAKVGRDVTKPTGREFAQPGDYDDNADETVAPPAPAYVAPAAPAAPVQPAAPTYVAPATSAPQPTYAGQIAAAVQQPAQVPAALPAYAPPPAAPAQPAPAPLAAPTLPPGREGWAPAPQAGTAPVLPPVPPPVPAEAGTGPF